MSKPFHSIEDQHNKLLSRGVEFNNAQKAKKHLLLNNYYNVVNCYSKFFHDSCDVYKEGTSFE